MGYSNKKSQKSRSLVSVLLLILWFGILSSCSTDSKKADSTTNDQKISNLVDSYTQGILSKKTPIKVRLLADIPAENQLADNSFFSVEPAIKGNISWIDQRTLVFTPEPEFKNGTEYNFSFNLEKLFKEPSSEAKNLSFSVRIIDLSLQVTVGALQLQENSDKYKVTGSITSSDEIDEAQVVNLIEANISGVNMPVKYESKGFGKLNFSIDDITREDDDKQLQLKWNGSAIGFKGEGSETVSIPSKNEFLITKAEFENQGVTRIKVIFSENLSKDQQFIGKIKLNDSDNLRFETEANLLYVYPRFSIQGGTNLSLRVEKEIKSEKKYELRAPFTKVFQFAEELPKVEFLGDGVILPRSGKLLVPFKAIGLRAVDIRIYKIFEKNIPQFLQVNTKLSSGEQLHRVSKFIKGKRVDLAALGEASSAMWNSYVVDIKDIIKTEPGAVYRLELSFTMKYVLSSCVNLDENLDEESSDLSSSMSSTESEVSYWDSYDESYYPDGYDWRERNNPCNISYYTKDKRRYKNVLASDIGIIAKSTGENAFVINVTDLNSAQPISDAQIDVLNFPLEKILTTKTQANGSALIQTNEKAWLIKVSHKDQSGYLTLNNTNLSLSSFPIAGKTVQNGVKGFLYTERGVRRPGDSLYVGFILEANKKDFPENHPVLFELSDSRQQLVERTAITKSVNGMYLFKTKTSIQAQTGHYTVTARVGGQSFTKTVPIETVKPNRLKIQLKTDPEEANYQTKTLSGTISSQWLHGAKANGLKAEISGSFTNVPFVSPNFADYSFTDLTRELQDSELKTVDVELNSEGEAKIDVPFTQIKQAPGRLKLNFAAKVFEKSGDFSVMSFSTWYHPYRAYVGVSIPSGDKRNMLLTDKKHPLQFVVLKPDEKPLKEQKVSYKVYKLRWRWWFEQSQEKVSDYFSRESVEPVQAEKTVMTDENGMASGDFQINYPDWGRYLVKVKHEDGGHESSKIVYVDWPGYAGRGRDTKDGGANIIQLSTEKENYTIGSKVKVFIPAPKGSNVLISIEKADKVLRQEWVQGNGEQTFFEFEADRNMIPNIFVHAHVIQPYERREESLPIRQYGVQKLGIDDALSRLYPIIESAEKFEPSSKAVIKVKEKNGVPFTYTLALVEDGLLDLTNFKTPDPHTSFFAHEALRVKTWDLFDLVSDSYLANSTKVISLGGDESLADVKNLTKVNRFDPVVKVLGPFTLEKGQTKTHEILLPNYIGSVRAMVVASDYKKYGYGEKTIPVKKDLMILATAPREVATNERFNVPITVFSSEEKAKTVSVRITTSGALKIKGDEVKEIQFATSGDQTAFFECETNSVFGASKITVEASSGTQKAYNEIELWVNDGLTDVVEVKDTVLASGQTLNWNLLGLGIPGTNSVRVSASSFSTIRLDHRLDGLIQYPHGCLEQTTSKLLAQLVIGDLKVLSTSQSDQIQKNINSGLNRLSSFINPSVGLSYWPGTSQLNQWSQIYAYHFMLLAAEKGYTIPSGLMTTAEISIKQEIFSWRDVKNSSNNKTLAYALYVLAKAGKQEVGLMNRLRESETIGNVGTWLLAAAYAKIGQSKIAEELAGRVNYAIKEDPNSDIIFETGKRSKAMALTMMIESGLSDGDLTSAMELVESLSNSRFYSTQETAFSLLALSTYINKNKANTPIYLSINFGADSRDIRSDALLIEDEWNDKSVNEEELTIKNKSEKDVFIRVIQKAKKPSLSVSASNKGLEMSIRYVDLDGKPISEKNLKPGESFIKEVVVSNKAVSELNYLALSQPIPSGWEILPNKVKNNLFKKDADSPDYQDVRDTHIYSYFGLKSFEKKTFRFVLMATYTGEFQMQPTKLSDMYKADFYAFSESGKVSVQE